MAAPSMNPSANLKFVDNFLLIHCLIIELGYCINFGIIGHLLIVFTVFLYVNVTPILELELTQLVYF